LAAKPANTFSTFTTALLFRGTAVGRVMRERPRRYNPFALPAAPGRRQGKPLGVLAQPQGALAERVPLNLIEVILAQGSTFHRPAGALFSRRHGGPERPLILHLC
jgi:hypothetical protein